MSIQYTVLGFEPMAFITCISSLNQLPGLLPWTFISFNRNKSWIFFRNNDGRRSDVKQLQQQQRGNSIKEIARMMALSDGSTLPSTRLESGYDDKAADDDLLPSPGLQQQQQVIQH